jgi:hypothetical protein
MTDIPSIPISEEDEEGFEKKCQRVDALLRKKKTKRVQRLKDLMKHRTTVEEGLTSRQVFNEVYFDIVEEYHDKKWDSTGESQLEDQYQERRKYLARVIKRLQKTDEFRWLSLVPCKNESGKIKEYRYVNVKPGEVGSYGYNLLSEVNAFWHKHAVGSLKGLERKQERLQHIAEMSEEEIERLQKSLDARMAEIEERARLRHSSKDKDNKEEDKNEKDDYRWTQTKLI